MENISYIEKLDRIIKILLAYKKGKVIEYDPAGSGERWHPASLQEILYQIGHDEGDHLRIANSSDYRPYLSLKEYLMDSSVHGPFLIKIGSTEKVLPTSLDDLQVSFDSGETYFSYFGLAAMYTWEDGYPCKCEAQE